ncbi:MAG TPA: efflux RND transporter periplasmic adaptor subunit [Rudaea sp.]|nr:efflux RND transporter periplasmic adaptor subunit [Rudaea sp.]HSC13369.1 efflux RND transporter periplasmic adaptor subunit [Rhodanobacteraceae bacterium]
MQARVENNKKPSTKKRMLIMIGLVLLLIVVIAGIKALTIYKMISGMKPPPPATVSTIKTVYSEWQPALTAIGSLRAARGADLALDVAGLVTKVNVQSGDEVKEGQVLLQLRDSEDVAQLHQLEAAAALAEVTFGRAKQQLAVKAISQADYDTAAADLKAKQAAVQQQQVNVAKKQLRAPFAGRVGIVTINPGAFLDSGKMIVTLQQLDPVFVDFHLPQKNLGELHVGQKVTLTLDAFGNKSFEGALSAISPKVDSDTRNVQVEARVPNPDRVLTPGMFTNASVEVGEQQRYLTLPQTAIVYNPYGETVFIVRKKSEFDKAQAALAKGNDAKGSDAKTQPAAKDAGKDKDGKDKDAGKGPQLPPDALVVQQVFVTTGATRGDQVAILKGLDEGAEIVTSGQIKLKSGSPITIDNSVQPANSANPTPQEH